MYKQGKESSTWNATCRDRQAWYRWQKLGCSQTTIPPEVEGEVLPLHNIGCSYKHPAWYPDWRNSDKLYKGIQIGLCSTSNPYLNLFVRNGIPSFAPNRLCLYGGQSPHNSFPDFTILVNLINRGTSLFLYRLVLLKGFFAFKRHSNPLIHWH